MIDDLLFASKERKAIIKKLQENSKKGLDRNTLIFELEMEKIYHKNDLDKEINKMIISGEILTTNIYMIDHISGAGYENNSIVQTIEGQNWPEKYEVLYLNDN